MRLCLIASKPTDAVTYGFLPAAERLGLEVFLLTDQPEAHMGALARAAVVTAGWPAGTGPAGERALAGSVPRIAGRGQARNVQIRHECTWQSIDWRRLADLIAAELTLATGTVNVEFVSQVRDGHAAFAAILEARAERSAVVDRTVLNGTVPRGVGAAG